MRRFSILRLLYSRLSLSPMLASQGGQTETSRGWRAAESQSLVDWRLTPKRDCRHDHNNAKFSKEGNALLITTGPAVTYWNPANKAVGDYTVKATFKEPKYMNLNNHPHPYGLMIAGNDLGTDQQSYLYCAAYDNGNFIVRGFGPAPFQLNGRGAPDPAVNKAAGVGEPVTQEIAMSVKGDKVECAINNKVVASFDKAALVVPGKLKSTDGVYGIRFAHNTEAIVTGLSVTKP